MLIYPAIDLRGGRVVRLTQGDYDRMTVYGDDPVAVAQGFVQAGATCLHAVDLDGAKDGSPQNRTVIGQLCKLPLSVEVGGGMRTEADVEAHARSGRGPGDPWHRGGGGFRHGRAVGRALGRAHRRGRGRARRQGGHARLARGERSGRRGLLPGSYADAGVATVIYTDIGRDGALSGTNLDIYARLSGIAGLQVIASGGVSFETEIAALRDMGLYGCILGKALYAGKLRPERALAIARGEAQPC